MTREKAIKHLGYVRDDYIPISSDAFDALTMAIKALEVEPCEDAVSRKMAMDAITASTPYCVVPDDYHISVVDMEFRVSTLPSVTPKQKRGKWLPENRTNDAFWVCSACGFPSEAHGANILYNFCPNCGARMKEEDA